MFALDLTGGLGLALALYAWFNRPADRASRWGLLLVLVFIAPLFRWLSAVFSFSIRLWLSEQAGVLLRLAGWRVAVHGNEIELNGQPFTVDPACMGLQMTGTAVFGGLLILFFREAQFRKALPTVWLMGYGLLLLLLTVVANLFRILILVIFSIEPADPLHDLVGLLCLLVYVYLPFWLLVNRLIHQKGTTSEGLSGKRPFGLIGSALVIGVAISLFAGRPVPPRPLPAPGGYAVKTMENGFLQYRNERALVYVKPVPSAWRAEHSPYICWRGSGYQFSRVEERQVGGRRVYVGTLQQGRQQLYTAWWFANGGHHTISQVDFRWRMLAGEPAFTLINVTVDKPEKLAGVIEEWCQSPVIRYVQSTNP